MHAFFDWVTSLDSIRFGVVITSGCLSSGGCRSGGPIHPTLRGASISSWSRLPKPSSSAGASSLTELQILCWLDFAVFSAGVLSASAWLVFGAPILQRQGCWTLSPSLLGPVFITSYFMMISAFCRPNSTSSQSRWHTSAPGTSPLLITGLPATPGGLSIGTLSQTGCGLCSWRSLCPIG